MGSSELAAGSTGTSATRFSEENWRDINGNKLKANQLEWIFASGRAFYTEMNVDHDNCNELF
jgi:hypothetical protein